MRAVSYVLTRLPSACRICESSTRSSNTQTSPGCSVAEYLTFFYCDGSGRIGEELLQRQGQIASRNGSALHRGNT